MAWPPKDGEPYMPANGTEGMDFEEQWCAHCSRDAAFRNTWDAPNGPEDGCDILANAMAGEQPAEWTWRNGKPHCSNFSDDPANSLRCPFTKEMQF